MVIRNHEYRDASRKGDVKYLTKRSRNVKGHNQGYKLSSTEVDRVALESGLQTLDDFYDTLTPSSFNKYKSPQLYDEFGIKYKRTLSEENSFYVIYPLNFKERSRIKAGDMIVLFDGVSEPMRVYIKRVHEDIRRTRSAKVFLDI